MQDQTSSSISEKLRLAMADGDGLHIGQSLASSTMAAALDLHSASGLKSRCQQISGLTCDRQITTREEPCEELTEPVEHSACTGTKYDLSISTRPPSSLFGILFSSNIYAKVWKVAQPELVKVRLIYDFLCTSGWRGEVNPRRNIEILLTSPNHDPRHARRFCFQSIPSLAEQNIHTGNWHSGPRGSFQDLCIYCLKGNAGTNLSCGGT